MFIELFFLNLATYTHNLFSYRDIIHLGQHTITGGQRAGVDEPHLLFVWVIDETPSKVQHWSPHNNFRNNTPAHGEKEIETEAEERGGKDLRLIYGSQQLLHSIMPKLPSN